MLFLPKSDEDHVSLNAGPILTMLLTSTTPTVVSYHIALPTSPLPNHTSSLSFTTTDTTIFLSRQNHDHSHKVWHLQAKSTYCIHGLYSFLTC